MLERIPLVAEHAEVIALVFMVVSLTYVSLILGELVPKRLALTQPERIAAIVAPPMQWLARIGRPIVYLLSTSTDAVLRLVGARQASHSGVTHEEIRLLLAQGADEGVFERSEHEMVSNVLNLDDRHVGSILTPRSDIVFLDTREPPERTRQKVQDDPHSVTPLCEGGLDHVIGVVRTVRVLDQLLSGAQSDLRTISEPAPFVPESMPLMKLLEQFKRTHLPLAMVVNEFGDVKGLASLTDVIASIVGDLPAEANEEPLIVRRDDGSWLIDGSVDLDSAARALRTDALLTEDERQNYHTLGGLAMLALGRIPRIGDRFDQAGFRFEVVDMDGHRVDRLLVVAATPGETARGGNTGGSD